MKERIEKAKLMHDSSPETAPLKILLVEDEPLIAMTITDILEEFGHRVFEAVSASEAIGIFERESPLDLLITDLGLPDMPGEQLARTLREKSAHLPILFATGRSSEAALPGEPLPPPLERLSKPFLMNELHDAITRLMASR